MIDLFDRVPASFSAAIEYGRALMEPIGLPFVWPRFLCGVSPHFAGLHHAATSDPTWPYTLAAHCVYPCHLNHRPAADRWTTVVMPVHPLTYRLGGPRAASVVVHELAHAIDAQIELSSHVWLCETSGYSRTSRAELFAEAVEILVCAAAGVEGYGHYRAQIDGEWFDPLRTALEWRG
jgi:hypothetical protein